jgi:prepilin-type N-terminal cleavage/methylation domain-containing protein
MAVARSQIRKEPFMSSLRRFRCGVTMIELIVVIGILLILAALLVPAVQKVREAAGRTQSMNNMKQLTLAALNCAESNQGSLPPIAGKVNNQDGSLLFHLLPFIEQVPLFKEANGQSWRVAGAVIPLYLDPQDASSADHLFQNAVATASYAGNWLVFKDGTNRFPQAIPDGTANTMMFATRYQICGDTPNVWAYSAIYTWTPMFAYYNLDKFQVNPRQDQCDPKKVQSFGPVAVIGLCDGSVRSVSPAISDQTWRAVLTPDGGEALGPDF